MRLFIALPLTPEVHTRLGEIITELKGYAEPVRWVLPENAHLTVRFLGDTDPSLLPRLQALVDETARSFPAVEVAVDRLGVFPDLRRPRVIWAGLAEVPAALPALAEQVERRVREFGFPPEKRGFKPHITIGRVKRDRRLSRLPDVIADYRMSPLSFRLDRLVLFQSTLTPQGPLYDALHTGMLTGQEV